MSQAEQSIGKYHPKVRMAFELSGELSRVLRPLVNDDFLNQQGLFMAHSTVFIPRRGVGPDEGLQAAVLDEDDSGELRRAGARLAVEEILPDYIPTTEQGRYGGEVADFCRDALVQLRLSETYRNQLNQVTGQYPRRLSGRGLELHRKRASHLAVRIPRSGLNKGAADWASYKERVQDINKVVRSGAQSEGPTQYYVHGRPSVTQV